MLFLHGGSVYGVRDGVTVTVGVFEGTGLVLVGTAVISPGLGGGGMLPSCEEPALTGAERVIVGLLLSGEVAGCVVLIEPEAVGLVARSVSGIAAGWSVNAVDGEGLGVFLVPFQ